jgi:hypothetical protein
VTEFTPVSALVGGAIIGLAAVLLMATNGRIAGISGIAGGLLPPWSGEETRWRVAFLAGLLAGPLAVMALTGAPLDISVSSSVPLMVGAGLLVGFGSALGGGCTSGHGVCGMARLSRRSIAATLTFMATAAATVFFIRHILGA